MTEEGAPPRVPSDPAVPTGQPDPSAAEGDFGHRDLDQDGARRDLRRAGVTAASLVVIGVPLGALWAGIAPRPDTAAVLAGADTALTAQMGADVCFIVITAVAGAVAGVFVWRFVREASWLVPLALALGGGVGALVAGAVGAAINSTVPGLAGIADQVGASLPSMEDLLRFEVRAKSVYFAFPLAALVVFLLLSYVAGERSGRRARVTAPPPQDHEPAGAG